MNLKKDFKFNIINIIFSKPISKRKFDFLINKGKLNEYLNVFGNPINLGPMKSHIYGVDKNCWKSIFLEINNKHFLIVLRDKIQKKELKNLINFYIYNIQKYITSISEVYLNNLKVF